MSLGAYAFVWPDALPYTLGAQHLGKRPCVASPRLRGAAVARHVDPRLSRKVSARYADVETTALRVRPGFMRAPVRRLYNAPRASRDSKASASTASELPWWNQEAALGRLTSFISKTPTEVLVLTGPVSSGKSRMLKQLVLRMKTASPAPAVIYVDCRSGIDSAEAFARALQLQALALTWGARAPMLSGIFSPLIQLISSAIDIKITTASPFSLNFSFAAKRLLNDLLPLEDVLVIYTKAIANARAVPGAPPPVLIVDEANRLCQWKSASQLSDLLAFFAQTSKQENTAHVILGTSDGAFTSWLGSRPGMNKQFYSTLYLADVSDTEAREFFNQCIPEVAPVVGRRLRASDADWQTIYEVCGGNIGALQRVATAVSDTVPDLWKEVVSSIASNAESHVDEGLDDFISENVTPAHYAAVALELLRAPGHAVPVSQLHKKFGKAVAAALLKANFIALQDAPPLGAGVDPDDPTATVKLYRPVCAAEVLIWRRMVQRLEDVSARLDHHRVS